MFAAHAKGKRMRVKEKLDNIRQSHFDIKLVPKNIGQLSKRYYEGPSGDADYGQMETPNERQLKKTPNKQMISQ